MTLRERVSTRQLEAWRGLLAAGNHVVGAVNAELEAAGALPLAWYDVLYTLQEQPGGRMRLAGLADAVLMSRSGLTRLLDRLEKKGLMRRVECPSDRRGLFAELTEAGDRALKRSWPAYSRALLAHFANKLDDSEVESLASILGKLAGCKSADRVAAE